MLNFALDYRVTINGITSNRDLNLHKYELEDDEWAVAERLRDTLEACDLSYVPIISLDHYLCRSSNTQLYSSLVTRQASVP